MLIWVIILASAIWVYFDARNIGVKKGLVPGMGNMGPAGWFVVTLLLWIIGFPMYLLYRGKFKLAVGATSNRANAPISGSAKAGMPTGTATDELERLAALKGRGLITESEFEAKKKQLLGL